MVADFNLIGNRKYFELHDLSYIDCLNTCIRDNTRLLYLTIHSECSVADNIYFEFYAVNSSFLQIKQANC